MVPIGGTTSGVVGGALRVFLSHTSELRQFPRDRSFVAAAEAAVIRTGHAVIEMDYFGARDSQPADTCVAKVTEAHVYVGIIGFRYGTRVRGRSDVSYTELEYETATRLRLPRLVFLVDDQILLSGHLSETSDLADRQHAFRQRLLEDAGLTVTLVHSPADLEVNLVHTLAELGVRSEATATTTRTLPRDVATFTGRGQELDRLLESALEVAQPSSVVAISAIDGMAGVGKTAFAVHAAHRLASNFPDGQLFLDLHGHTVGQLPVTPGDALSSLLLAIGVAPAAIPAGVDDRAALWRGRLAGKRILILLDDAAGQDQIRPLLPGTSGCQVIITSRRRLAALEDVKSLSLGSLPPAHAVELLARLLGPRASGSDSEALGELVHLCGYLPLAIGLVAGRLRSHSTWAVQRMIEALKESQNRLSEIRAENVEVETAFTLSYRNLPVNQQRLFRRLGLHPGRDVDAYTAAALDDDAAVATQSRLEALYADHLIDEPIPGRYRLHDLIYQFARSLASRDDSTSSREAAVDRLFDYYLGALAEANRHAATADRHIAAPSDATTPPTVGSAPDMPSLSTRKSALAWLEAERSNMDACFDYAMTHSLHSDSICLAHSLHSYLRMAGYWDRALSIHQAALMTARLIGDRSGEATALIEMGVVQRLRGMYPTATKSLLEALDLYGELGDHVGRANALNHLAFVQRLTDDYTAALATLTEALKLYRQMEQPLGQAMALLYVGRLQFLTNQYALATVSLVDAVNLFRDRNDWPGQANGLDWLSELQYVNGDYQAAVASLKAAWVRYRDLGDQQSSAYACYLQGMALYRSREYSAAVALLSQAVGLYRNLGDPHGQALTLHRLGTAQRLIGDYPAAAASLMEAVRLCRSLGELRGQALALNELGVVRRLRGELLLAMSCLNQALVQFQNLASKHGEAEAMNNIGDLLLDAAELQCDAASQYEQALRISREYQLPMEEARALEGIGRCSIHSNNTPDGVSHLRQALEIYHRLGVPEAERVKTTLATSQR